MNNIADKRESYIYEYTLIDNSKKGDKTFMYLAVIVCVKAHVLKF